MVFEDREDAGRRLAEALAEYRGQNALVLGIPRGGVVLAYIVAEALNADLDVVIPRKLPAPGNPELAIGAVAADGTVVLDPLSSHYPEVTPEYIEEAKEAQVEEIERRQQLYRRDRHPLQLEGRIVIVVDDGIATGNTVLAALRSLRRLQPKELILAIPVAPPTSLERLEHETDRVVVLATPEPFFAVGQWYRHFDQVSDEEVISLLARSRRTVAAVAG